MILNTPNYIEQEDFKEDPPKKFFRLAPGREVRLRYAYFITCVDVIKNENGDIVELRCTYDHETRGGDAPDGRKVKGTLHWVSADLAIDAEVRLYNHLFLKSDPDDVEDFVKKTGVDSLAISIGTSHGAYKFKVKPGESPPPLRFDILEDIEKRIPGFPIVLHGASSVLPVYVELINKYGGQLEGAVGVSEDQLRKAARSAVCKVNIDSDGRLVVTAMVRKMLTEDPKNFDPRKYLGPAREELIQMIIRKNREVLGSADRA